MHYFVCVRLLFPAINHVVNVGCQNGFSYNLLKVQQVKLPYVCSNLITAEKCDYCRQPLRTCVFSHTSEKTTELSNIAHWLFKKWCHGVLYTYLCVFKTQNRLYFHIFWDKFHSLHSVIPFTLKSGDKMPQFTLSDISEHCCLPPFRPERVTGAVTCKVVNSLTGPSTLAPNASHTYGKSAQRVNGAALSGMNIGASHSLSRDLGAMCRHASHC